MKKKTRLVWGLLALCVLLGVAGVWGMQHFKPDWHFVLHDALFHAPAPGLPQASAPAALQAYTVAQLQADPRVQIDQSLLLINTAAPLQADFVPDLLPFADTDVQMNRCLHTAFAALQAELQTQFAQRLRITSAYRSAQEQAETLSQSDTLAQKVNASEHQAGLALDVCVPYYGGASFLKTEIGQYVNKHCARFGFIVRYPYYGRRETGIPFEPWHLRYVGQPHATLIMANRLTLESYLAYFEVGQFYTHQGLWLSRQIGDCLQLPQDFSAAVLSADNLGGYFLTVTP